ncbi:vascular endothelial zinc finger 1-like isoform X1 [Synchiropus splendidus]|uniref:vascular endothelial zinc finger 1-like isoform X1 n=1 Tax=Synchiropus splendidus TaxID=270530 RepID=UPI00237E1D29|nr:vascular endothelial zinc finger 1-like isoform X1 [Synchiropus splendidus]
MEPSWSTFLFQQANEALHHQHQVAQNSLLPLLNAGTEQIDQKPILPIQIDQKPLLPIQIDQKNPSSAAELLKDNVASGGGARPPVPVIKKEHKGKTPFVCGYCNKAFRDSYHLRRHESSHTGIKMVSRPKKTAQTAPTMVPMISTMPRENNGQQSYISTVAGILSTATTSVSSGTSIMTSSAMGNMQQQNIPKKPPKPVKKNHGCEMCGKAFRDVYHLNRHKLSHSDEKPFECPICQQRFKRKDRMTYHVRSHDGGVHKPYVCSVCGKGFSRPDHLSCHVKHVHSSERPFKCQVTACTSAFATKDRLRSHMIRHEGKVTCSICGKMLSAAYITSHLKTHGQTNFNACNKGKKTSSVNDNMNSRLDTSGLSYHYGGFGGRDANDVCNSASATPVTISAPITTAMNRINMNNNNAVTIAAQMNISTNTVNITSPVSLQHPVTITGPVNIASVNIPATAPMNIAHPVAITTPMPMNIAGPLNIAMRPVDSMPFLSQVLPSSPPW